MKCPWTKKKIFLTPEEAQPYLDEGKRSEHPIRAQRLHVYRCPWRCGGFHIGHDFGPAKAHTARRGKHAKRKIPASQNP